MSNKEHWENVFATKAENAVSWFQMYPKTSMEFTRVFNLKSNAAIIDIGGGDSHFAEALVDAGFTNVHVLDISGNALERAKKRLGEKALLVKWIESDITEYKPELQFDFWHDRAAFHFLTSEEKIDKYVGIAERSVKANGYLVLGTFSENGSLKCSGLEIKQYNEASMSDRFKESFEKIRCFTEDHTTPFNTVQNFQFCSFKRK